MTGRPRFMQSWKDLILSPTSCLALKLYKYTSLKAVLHETPYTVWCGYPRLTRELAGQFCAVECREVLCCCQWIPGTCIYPVNPMFVPSHFLLCVCFVPMTFVRSFSWPALGHIVSATASTARCQQFPKWRFKLWAKSTRTWCLLVELTEHRAIDTFC